MRTYRARQGRFAAACRGYSRLPETRADGAAALIEHVTPALVS